MLAKTWLFRIPKNAETKSIHKKLGKRYGMDFKKEVDELTARRSLRKALGLKTLPNGTEVWAKGKPKKATKRRKKTAKRKTTKRKATKKKATKKRKVAKKKTTKRKKSTKRRSKKSARFV